MLFNSNVFLFAFLPAVFTLFWVGRTKQQRYVLLTVASYIFYGWWDWRFCFLLLCSSLVSFAAGLLIEGAPTARRRRGIMAVAVSLDLASLGFFKYYDFFAASLHQALPFLALPLLHVILPIGISFYTFHTISYVVDVADGRVRPTHNLFEYLTYVSLFCQLIAGPIIRYRQIEADLEAIDGPPRPDWMARGLGFFVVGLIKKVIVADSIGGLIDPMLAAPAGLTTMAAWLAALGFTLQLYFDFSGYSDMAVGLGYLFGLRIPQNFDAPYRAAGIRDFWRRWHISLSTFLRDYLYIRLGGNRRGAFRTHVNLMITMLLGGLWHGANWTFVIWGGYHGVLLILDRAFEPRRGRVPAAVRRAVTFLLVVIGWVIFRSTSLTMAGTWLSAMAGLGTGTEVIPRALIDWALVGLVAVNTLPETWDIRFGVTRRWAVVYAVGFFIAYLYLNETPTIFLYYQF
jgi:alginate O-acetyltransferase complex protein AlgI